MKLTDHLSQIKLPRKFKAERSEKIRLNDLEKTALLNIENGEFNT